MKSRKVYLYGILMLIILIAFVGCAADKNLEEIIKTPEDLVIAYIEEFSQENFKKIETMFEESANFGKEYYSQSQLAPKDDLEIIKSQNLFITHFYGEDAWNNVEYELEEITLKNNNSANTTSNLENEVDSDMDAYIETKSIKKYRANFVFNDLPLHLLGFENIHIIVSNESGNWMVKEGLTWDVNLYGGGPVPDYFQGSEASYRTIDRDHKPEDVMYVLGNTMNREEAEEDGYYTFDLKYGDAIFYFFNFGDENGELDNNYTLDGITVQSGEYSMLRDIKIGDSFYETMSKFPRERDWLSDPDNVFYGNGTLPHDTNSFGGTCHSWVEDDGTKRDSINIKDQDCVATVNFQFYNGILESMDMYYISYL